MSVPDRSAAVLRAAVGDNVALVPADLESGNRHELALVVLSAAAAPALIGEYVGAGHRVLLLLERDQVEAELAGIAAGAIGCVALDAPTDALTRMLRAALAGEFVYSRRAISEWLRQRDVGAKTARVTARERATLNLIAEGASNREIAAQFRIKKSTVDKHVSNVLRKLRVSTRAAAVAAYRSATEMDARYTSATPDSPRRRGVSFPPRATD